MTVNARVRKHRDNLRSQDCERLDVWVGSGWIRSARTIAKWQKRPLWQLVQDALKAYVRKMLVSSEPPRIVTGNGWG